MAKAISFTMPVALFRNKHVILEEQPGDLVVLIRRFQELFYQVLHFQRDC